MHFFKGIPGRTKLQAMQKTSSHSVGKPSRKAAAIAAKPAQVIEELRPGQSIELLKELHILTREGKLNQDTRRKLKQVYHLYQFIAPLLDEVSASQNGFTLADHGAIRCTRANLAARSPTCCAVCS